MMNKPNDRSFDPQVYRDYRKEKFTASAELATDFLTEWTIVNLSVASTGHQPASLVSFTQEEWEKIKALVDGAFSGKLQGDE